MLTGGLGSKTAAGFRSRRGDGHDRIPVSPHHAPLSSYKTGCIVCSTVTGGGSWSTTRTGATGGGGVETLIFPNVTARLEYRYTDLGRFTEYVPLATNCAGGCSSPSNTASISLHPTFQTVTFGLALNF
jgi:opacity protein-like surface antigen